MVHEAMLNPVARLQVKGTWENLDGEWAALALEVMVAGEWLVLCPELMVARRFSGVHMDREAPGLSIVSALKRELESGGATVLEFADEQQQLEDGRDTWRWTAWMGAKLTVAVQDRPVEGVRVVRLQ